MHRPPIDKAGTNWFFNLSGKSASCFNEEMVGMPEGGTTVTRLRVCSLIFRLTEFLLPARFLWHHSKTSHYTIVTAQNCHYGKLSQHEIASAQ
ncbi:hypothetical protein FHG87_007650 [Trinorchestia longiramus]|nr:hypothetical protein FHG87_007650 [Trinorchestia longiramus]